MPFFLRLLLVLWAICLPAQAEEEVGTTPSDIKPYVRPHAMPAPKLLTPVTDVVDMSGRAFLRFQWEAQESDYPVWYYELRIYSGTDMTGAALITAKRTSERTTALLIPTDYFKDGKTYIWSVIQVSPGPVFSPLAVHYFEARKRY